MWRKESFLHHEIIFPQHMAHEVRPKGTAQLRRNATHRVWVPTEALNFALPKNVCTQPGLQAHLKNTAGWKFWRLSEQDWIAGRQNRKKWQQKEHFSLATTELPREQVREGRTIWQCGPKFDYRTSKVRPGGPPPEALRRSTTEVLQGMPFKEVQWAQSIYNEYHRNQKPQAAYKMPTWEGFKGTTHPWIEVNRQRPLPGKRVDKPSPHESSGWQEAQRPVKEHQVGRNKGTRTEREVTRQVTSAVRETNRAMYGAKKPKAEEPKIWQQWHQGREATPRTTWKQHRHFK